jgi:ABC-type sugar transport system ATPase subunit
LTLTETRRLLELCKDLKAENISIVYISHRHARSRRDR